MRSLVTAILMLVSAAAIADPLCPAPNLQPLFRYGEAFGDSTRIADYPIAKKYEEKVVLQYIEYQTFEPGYSPVFAVSLVRRIDDKGNASEPGLYRASLVREKSPNKYNEVGAITVAFREIPAALSERAIASTTSTLLRVHYPSQPSSVMCTDGFVFDVAIMFAPGYGSLAGQAYEPPSDSEAGAIATFGRTLRSYVEGKATTKELDTAIDSVERHNNSFKPKPLRGSA
jgi:hypothetical protein